MSFQIELTVDLRLLSKFIKLSSNQTELIKIDNPSPNIFYFFALNAEVQLIDTGKTYTVNGVARAIEVEPMASTFALISSFNVEGTINDRPTDIKLFNQLRKKITKYFSANKYLAICCLEMKPTKLNRLLADQLRAYGVKSTVGLRNHLQNGSWGCVLYNDGNSVSMLAEKARDSTVDNFVYYPLSHHHTYIDKTELTRILNQDTTIEEVPTILDLDVIVFFLYGFVLNNLLPVYPLLLGIKNRFTAVIEGDSDYGQVITFEQDQAALSYYLQIYVNITIVGAIPLLHDQSLSLLSKTNKLKTADSPSFIKDLTQMLETVVKVVVDINYKIVNPVLNDPVQIDRYFALLGRLGYF